MQKHRYRCRHRERQTEVISAYKFKLLRNNVGLHAVIEINLIKSVLLAHNTTNVYIYCPDLFAIKII